MLTTNLALAFLALSLAACESTHLHGDFDGELSTTSTLTPASAAAPVTSAATQAVHLERDGDAVAMSLIGCTFALEMKGLAEAAPVSGQACPDPATGTPLTWSGEVGTNRNGTLLSFELVGKPATGPGDLKLSYQGRR